MKPQKLTSILILSIAIGLLPNAHSVVPPPDGGYPGNNTAEGRNALLSLGTGTFNTAVGSLALKSDANGGGNTAVGAGTLLANTADQNTATGVAALLSNTTGADNMANGALALLSNTTGDRNNACGAFTLFSNTTGGANNAMGYKALFNNESGSQNNAHGDFALFSNVQGQFNTAIGGNALVNNMSGNNNTAVGFNALQNSSIGSNNIALGFGAGSNIITASDTICIGAPGVNVTDGCYFGHVFEEALDPDHLAMAIDVNGKVGTPPSSRRFKEDIKPMDTASEVILALKPVTFHYKNDAKRSPRFGLIAEEVAEIDPSLVAFDKERKPYSVRYDQVNAMLLNEFLKEHKKVRRLEVDVAEQRDRFEATIAELKKEIADVVARSKDQDEQIEKVRAQVELNNTPARTVATKY
jgi:Chaperone of endosialidase